LSYIKYKNHEILDLSLSNWGEGINRIEQNKFAAAAKKLLDWCFLRKQRVIIISHDGTITNYRIVLGEKGLTREDFLGETGVYKTRYVG
jgi:hypothetical protein